jgi:hypothetical protein
VDSQSGTEEHRADICASQRQAQVSGFAGGYGIDGKAARVTGGQGKDFTGKRHKGLFRRDRLLSASKLWKF